MEGKKTTDSPSDLRDAERQSIVDCPLALHHDIVSSDNIMKEAIGHKPVRGIMRKPTTEPQI